MGRPGRVVIEPKERAVETRVASSPRPDLETPPTHAEPAHDPARGLDPCHRPRRLFRDKWGHHHRGHDSGGRRLDSSVRRGDPGRIDGRHRGQGFGNTASQDEIAAALAAAGVPNADRWAREVTEYRPYPTDDPTLAKLQDNLAKYDPNAATLQAILSALRP